MYYTPQNAKFHTISQTNLTNNIVELSIFFPTQVILLLHVVLLPKHPTPVPFNMVKETRLCQVKSSTSGAYFKKCM